jgi:hypothetical protein
MKKSMFFIALISGIFFSQNAHAQVHVSLNINIDAQPKWGPVGYQHVDYYYMPDIDVFYDVPGQHFIYMEGGRWIFAAALPHRYEHFDMYRGYKVVVNEPRPYLHCDVYREQYGKYKGHYGEQTAIRDHHHVEGQEDQYDHPGNHGKGHAYGHDKHHDD